MTNKIESEDKFIQHLHALIRHYNRQRAKYSTFIIGRLAWRFDDNQIAIYPTKGSYISDAARILQLIEALGLQNFVTAEKIKNEEKAVIVCWKN